MSTATADRPVTIDLESIGIVRESLDAVILLLAHEIDAVRSGFAASPEELLAAVCLVDQAKQALEITAAPAAKPVPS